MSIKNRKIREIGNSVIVTLSRESLLKNRSKVVTQLVSEHYSAFHFSLHKIYYAKLPIMGEC